MEEDWKFSHLLSPWPSLQVTLLSFPSACFLKQGGDYFYFLLTTKLNEERSFSGSEMQLYVSESLCRFRSNFQSIFFSAEKNGRILEILKFCFQVSQINSFLSSVMEHFNSFQNKALELSSWSHIFHSKTDLNLKSRGKTEGFNSPPKWS